MSEQTDWVTSLRGIIDRMVLGNVTELELQQGNLSIKLRRAPSPLSPLPNHPSEDEPAPRDQDRLHRVVAPLTGVFYAAPNPNSKPYVAPGDWVESDTVVGLIETMKVFNEVTAECRGRVVSILVGQGQLVHANEPILLVDTEAAPDGVGEVAP